MSTRATGTLDTKSWEEKTFTEIDGGGKLTHANVTMFFRGDLEGETTLQYLMVYLGDNTGSFLGLEHVVGKIGDRSGSFVLQHNGTFGNGTVKGTVTVVPGSATRELRGLRGEGSWIWDGQEGKPTPYTFDYEFA